MLQQLGDRSMLGQEAEPLVHLGSYGIRFQTRDECCLWERCKGLGKHRGVRTDGDDQNHTTPREQYKSANLQWDIGRKQARALWTGLGSWVSDWLSADAWAADVRLMVLWSRFIHLFGMEVPGLTASYILGDLKLWKQTLNPVS